VNRKCLLGTDFTTFSPYTNTIFLDFPHLEPYTGWCHLARTLNTCCKLVNR